MTELEEAKRKVAAMIDTVFAKCTAAEIIKCERACAALMAAVAPNTPDLVAWVHVLFAERRARKAARLEIA